MTFLQDFSRWGRKKAQRVSISQQDLRVSFLHYIMGRLPESDRARFEEQLLEDQDLSDAAAACEQELIDTYALHRLDAEETRTVGLWIEASRDRVERVAMARALLRATPQRSIRRRRIGATVAIAASLFAAAALYLVSTRVLHPPQKKTPPTASYTSPRNNQSASAAAPSSGPTRPDVVLIAAEPTRGEQKTATCQVHRQSPIQLKIVLPGETARSAYQVRLTTLAYPNKALLQQNHLEAQPIPGQTSQLYLTLTLPAGSLPPATYTASVSRQGERLASTFTLKWANK